MTRPPLAALALSLALVSCAHKPSESAKLNRAEELNDEVGTLVVAAEAHLRAFEVDDAKSKLMRANDLLKDPAIKFSPDSELTLERYKEAVARYEVVKKEKAARDLKLAVDKQLVELEKARTRVLSAVEKLDKPQLTRREIDEARSASNEMQARVRDGKPLEERSDSYRDDVKLAGRSIDRANAAIALAEKRLAFIEGPAAAYERSQKLLEEVAQEKDLEAKRRISGDARNHLQTCRDEGKKRIAEEAELASASVSFAGKGVTVTQAISTCDKGVSSVDKQLAQLTKQIDKAAKDRAKAEAKEAKAAAKQKGKKTARK
jgi:hypothetical protein